MAASSTTPGVMAAVGGASIHARDDEFPLLCETCLGENPLVRMTKEHAAKACKVCERPFTVYRWKPGPKARYKKTELCHTCAKLKNCCQTCILDLQFGLPLAVRDQALAEHARLSKPKSDVGRGYMIEAHEKAIEQSGAVVVNNAVVDVASLPKGSMLERLAHQRQREPYYKRNLAHLCTFFARGECNRGVLCPYQHVMPQNDELSKQNFKSRYYGLNDPVANKMMRKFGGGGGSGGALVPPEDKSITTLWIGGVDESMTEDELRVRFYPFGELQSIRLVPLKSCAFVSFQSRVAAEEAAKKLADKLVIRGRDLRISWAKPKGDANTSAAAAAVPSVAFSFDASGSPAPSAAAAASSGPPGIAGPPPGIGRPAVMPPPGISFPAPPPGIGQLNLAAADSRQGATKLDA